MLQLALVVLIRFSVVFFVCPFVGTLSEEGDKALQMDFLWGAAGVVGVFYLCGFCAEGH